MLKENILEGSKMEGDMAKVSSHIKRIEIYSLAHGSMERSMAMEPIYLLRLRRKYFFT